MIIHRRLRRILRNYYRQELLSHAISGARVAHLPSFLDRMPRHNMHRAYQAAFMRGFLWEQRALGERA
jgi:hypothetical protein